MRPFAVAWRLLLNTLFPPVCVSCKKEGEFLCADCLARTEKRTIRKHGEKQPDPDLRELDGLIYALNYAKNPMIKAAVKQLKYRFTQELADTLGGLMAEKIGELNMARNRPIVLIPVPLHSKRLSYRGFNQADLIAKAIKANLGDRAEVIPLLERIRHTSQQAKLDKIERHKNLEGAFKMSKKITQEQKIYSKNILYFLVDDVCTTASTLENCAHTLKKHGYEKIYGLVVARAFRK